MKQCKQCGTEVWDFTTKCPACDVEDFQVPGSAPIPEKKKIVSEPKKVEEVKATPQPSPAPQPNPIQQPTPAPYGPRPNMMQQNRPIQPNPIVSAPEDGMSLALWLGILFGILGVIASAIMSSNKPNTYKVVKESFVGALVNMFVLPIIIVLLYLFIIAVAISSM